MKRDAPATHRNREPILAVLRQWLPDAGTVLEVGCGTGQHAAFFAGAFPGLRWHPTDFDPAAVASTRAWRAEAALPNLAEPAWIDASAPDWPLDAADVVFSANVVHISPPAVLDGLVGGAGRRLPAGGLLVLYGPFNIGGAFTSPSNERFDGWLKSLDPTYGVRDLERVDELAGAAGLQREAKVEMPANNFTLVFRKAA